MKRVAHALVLGLVVLLGTLGLPARAWWLGPSNWPIERMLANVERYVARHPEAAEAHYCLGRIHSYAFVFESAQLAVSAGKLETFVEELAAERVSLDELARLVARPGLQRGQEEALPRVPPEALLRHLDQAVRALRRALELAPERGAFHLTLAYTLERGAHLGASFDNASLFGLGAPPPDAALDRVRLGRWIQGLGDPEQAAEALAALSDPARLASYFRFLDRERASSNAMRQANVAKLLQRWWLDRAIEHYRIAFERTLESDAGVTVVDDHDGLVSLEAGEGYLRLTREVPDRLPAPEGFRARVGEAVRELQQKPYASAATPIVLSLDGCRTLDELIAPGLSVLFDVDGDLVEEAWPWLRPDAGWLVWDPEHTGAITSGRQLFGSASGWFFFSDGYRVLDALDDDGDGELRGAELGGIAVWIDRNSDGVSVGSEVTPVEALGIVALATQATERVGASLGNPCGLELADGRILPTYDWVLESQQPEAMESTNAVPRAAVRGSAALLEERTFGPHHGTARVNSVSPVALEISHP